MQIENREGLEFNYFEESKLMPVAGLHNLDDDILDDELEDADQLHQRQLSRILNNQVGSPFNLRSINNQMSPIPINRRDSYQIDIEEDYNYDS